MPTPGAPAEVRSRVAVTDSFEASTSAVAVVTGAGRGIGRAIARRLCASHIVVAVARNEAELAEAASGFPSIRPHRADIGVRGAMVEIAAVAAALGRLTVWVNNAATLEPQPFTEITDEDWREVMAVNLDAAFVGCREAVRLMGAGGGGVIVNIASLSGVAGGREVPRSHLVQRLQGGADRAHRGGGA